MTTFQVVTQRLKLSPNVYNCHPTHLVGLTAPLESVLQSLLQGCHLQITKSRFWSHGSSKICSKNQIEDVFPIFKALSGSRGTSKFRRCRDTYLVGLTAPFESVLQTLLQSCRILLRLYRPGLPGFGCGNLPGFRFGNFRIWGFSDLGLF